MTETQGEPFVSLVAAFEDLRRQAEEASVACKQLADYLWAIGRDIPPDLSESYLPLAVLVLMLLALLVLSLP